jgi:hypothetical protein
LVGRNGVVDDFSFNCSLFDGCKVFLIKRLQGKTR